MERRPLVLVNGVKSEIPSGDTLIGSAIEIEQPSAATTTYDSQGRVDAVTETMPSGSRVTTMSYDTDGRVSTVSISFGGVTRTETYTYNTDGQLTGMSATEV